MGDSNGINVTNAYTLTGGEYQTFLEQYGYPWIIYLVICGVLALLIVCGNLVVIIVLWKNKNLRNPQAIYRISIAFSDLITGLVLIPFHIFTWTCKTADLTSSPFTLKIMGIFAAFTVWISMHSLIISGFDRLFAVLYPMKYRRYLSEAKRSAVAFTVIIWIIFSVLSICCLYFPEHLSVFLAFQIYDNDFICHSPCMGVIGVSISVVWLNNIVIFVSVRRQSQKMKKTSSGSLVHLKREINLAKSLIIMSTAFTLSLSPYIILLMSPNVDVSLVSAATWGVHVAIMISFSNSFWNCIIYSFRSKDFRNAVKDTLLHSRSRETGSDTVEMRRGKTRYYSNN